jgi:DNA mismatch repair protein MutL
MSGIIQLLPDHIANQIAAGEVIQRPASVVKEMMENAIDAGADKVQVIVKDAGRTLIQIIDNGSGMVAEDAVKCFERHATSKVRTADDLFALTTKGFRGEALASISAIAHVVLKTKKPEAETGTTLTIEGSKLSTPEETICTTGTSFEVKNLFYNVPARRNFLKSDNVEFGHIRDEFERIALAHPDTSFTLFHNDAPIYQLQQGILRKRIVDILGRQANDKLVPIEEETSIVSVKGFVGKPEFSKKSRGEQFLFVNNRYFKDTYFNHAITKAFDGLIPPKFFPSYFLYLTVDPSKIDVNVHPTKTEIKFEEDRHIYSILLSSIRQALGKYNIAPTLDFDREGSFDLPLDMKHQPIVEPQIKVNPEYNPFKTTSHSGGSSSTSKGNGFSQAIRAEGFGNSTLEKSDWDAFYAIQEENIAHQEELLQTTGSEFQHKDFVFSGRYLLTSADKGFYVIDAQHAYQRIIYDELMNNFITNPIASQQLLFPYEKDCSKKELDALDTNKTLLERFGFSWKVEDQQIQLIAVPAVLQEESISDCLDGILEKTAYQTIDKGEIAHAVVLSIAAASARKKKISNNEQARQLMEQFQLSTEQLSPQGKKVIEILSLEELSNRFKY